MRSLVAVAVATALLGAGLSAIAVARVIRGSDRGEVIGGTRHADRIIARGGNDFVGANAGADLTKGGSDSEARLMEMLAAQAAHAAAAGFEDEDAIAADEKRSEDEKRDTLQRTFIMAASNGNVESVNKILKGKARDYVDVNAPDDEGTTALIYASCFVSWVLARGVFDRPLISDAGPRIGSPSPHRRWRRREQAGPEPVERPHRGSQTSARTAASAAVAGMVTSQASII